MIPNENFSSQDFPAPLINPWSGDRKVSYHMGPVQVQDPSQGLLVKLWTARAEEDKVLLSAPGSPTITVFQHTSDLESVGLAFDQNGRHCISFEDAEGDNYLYWFDPVPNDYVFMPVEGSSVVITLDDTRSFNLVNSDVILAYISGGGIKYRQQRDRFLIEYTPVVGPLGPPVAADILYHISAQTNLRLSFIYGDIPKIWGVSNLVRKQITQQKASAEVLTLPFEFRQMMMFGEYIVETSSVMTVYSGEDSAPEDLLGEVSYTQTVVSQVVSGGIVGVVYKLAISILTDQGSVYVMEGLIYVNDSEAASP